MSDERMLMTHGSISILAGIGMLEELSMSMGQFKPGQNAGTCMIFVYNSALVTTHAVHNEQCKKTYSHLYQVCTAWIWGYIDTCYTTPPTSYFVNLIGTKVLCQQ